MHSAKAATLALTLFASGCAAGPDYQPPAPLPTVAGAFITSAPGTQSGEGQDRWWRLYDDPVLDHLIEQALVTNTDLRVAAANLRRAQAVLQESRMARLPSTDLNGGVSYGDGFGPNAGAQFAGSEQQWSQSGSLAVAWEADLFGRVRRSIEAARADAATIAAARDRVVVVVVAETARAYADACTLGESEAIVRQSIRIAQQGLALTQARFAAGSAATFDVERAAGALADARAALPPLVGQRQARLFELAALVGGMPADIPVEARDCIRSPAPVASIPVGDGVGLLARRPDVREAERRLAADTARIGIATADLYPRISLGASGNFFRNDQVRGSDAFSFSVGPLLSWSFPNIAAARARVAQAEAGAQASLATFDGVVLGAFKEVEQALAAYAAQQGRRDALAESVTRAETAHRLAERRYRAGAISFLDLLDAQRQLVQGRIALTGSMQALGSARIDLFKALGGGWQAAAPKAGDSDRRAGNADSDIDVRGVQ